MTKIKSNKNAEKAWADKWQLDAEEAKALFAFENESAIFSPEQTKIKQEAMAAAKDFSRKNARLNIRISDNDLLRLKLKASQEGLPYQTLAASIIHKFVH